MAEHAGSSMISAKEETNKISWIDRFVNWVDQLPLSPWVFYVAAVFLTALFLNLIFWIDGGLAFGSFDTSISLFSIFVFYWLALYQYLTRMATDALKNFSPLLDENDFEIVRIKAQLTTLPTKQGWLAIPIGLVLAALTIFSEPEPYGDIIPNTAIPYIVDLAMTGFMVMTLYGLIVRSIRQIRTVAKLHTRAGNINLLKLGPAHAFSTLTARTGIGVLFVGILGALIDDAPANTVVDLFWYLVISIISIALFVMPIIGMRDRLEEEKTRVLNEIGDLLQSASSHLHEKVSQGNYQALGEHESAVKALSYERELLEKVSTWPWDTRTLRGFTSALILPIVIWIVTRLLEDFF